MCTAKFKLLMWCNCVYIHVVPCAIPYSIGGQNIYNTMKHNYAAGLVIMAMGKCMYTCYFPPVWKFEPVLPATCGMFISLGNVNSKLNSGYMY